MPAAAGAATAKKPVAQTNWHTTPCVTTEPFVQLLAVMSVLGTTTVQLSGRQPALPNAHAPVYQNIIGRPPGVEW
jgi:hypothetical protein